LEGSDMSWAHPREVARPVVTKLESLSRSAMATMEASTKPRKLLTTPKNLFGALGAVVMTATSGPEETQSQSLAVFGLA